MGCLKPVCTCVAFSSVHMCGCVGANLQIRPSGDTFTKPVGGSVVITCSLVKAAGDEVDDVTLSWLDDNDKEVTSLTGR